MHRGKGSDATREFYQSKIGLYWWEKFVDYTPMLRACHASRDYHASIVTRRLLCILQFRRKPPGRQDGVGRRLRRRGPSAVLPLVFSPDVG